MKHGARIADDWLAGKIRWIILILALLTVAQLGYFSYGNRTDSEHRNKVTTCQVDYNQAVARVTKLRAGFADRDRNSLLTFIREISTAKTRAESRASLDKYLRTQRQIDDERKSHPIPDLPEGKCA